MVKDGMIQPYTIERASKTSLTKEEFERFNQYLIMNDYMMAMSDPEFRKIYKKISNNNRIPDDFRNKMPDEKKE